MNRTNWPQVAALVAMGALLIYFWNVNFARAHDHSTPAGKFYETWMMPDAPHISCCNEKDCYPTEARKTPTGWEAKRREDGKWLRIPESKIERNRDNPDGRNHLCAPPPDGDRVFCFILGGAI